MTIGKIWARTNRKTLDLIALVFLGLFAYRLTFMTGERGFLAYNQSPAFDAGYRILSGQVPFKDFIFSHGCVVFALQAAFFKLLGVNYFAYVFGAAIVNAAAALLALFIVRILFPERRALSYLAGFLTAIWFYPPAGTPQHNYTGLFFTLAALCVFLHSIFHFDMTENGRRALFCLSGSFAFAAFMSSQEMGLLMLPLYPALLTAACSSGRKNLIFRCSIFYSGFLLCGLMFALWVWRQSNWDDFWLYAIMGPVRELARRIYGGGWRMVLETLLLEFNPVVSVPLWMRIGTLMSYLISFLVLRRILLSGLSERAKDGGPVDRKQSAPAPGQGRQAVAALLSIGLIHLQYFFNDLPVGRYHREWPLVGVLFSFALGFWMDGHRYFHFGRSISDEGSADGARGKTAGRIFAAVSVILAIFLSQSGIQIAFTRQAHFPTGMLPADFSRSFKEDGLKNLKWGAPTVVVDETSSPMAGFELRADDVSELLRVLKAKNKNFFIFPDHTIFYGLAGTPSPQPLLSFHVNEGYYSSQMDRRIVMSLIKNDVDIIIMEEISPWGVLATLNDFPFLSVYIRKCFKPAEKIGFFNLYELK